MQLLQNKSLCVFFIDIKMAMMKKEPQILEGVNLKALSELKWEIRLDARAECVDEPMEICHSRRRISTEVVSSV